MSNVKMIKVDSSIISSIGYDKSNELVYVKFNNGSLYEYKDVPQDMFDNLLNAPSIGSYLHHHFKDVFSYKKL